jgi:hypothetical protein
MSDGRTNQPENGEAPARRRFARAWEDLRDVLARLVHAGWADQDAKEDICNALAEVPPDRKIDFRAMVHVVEDDDDGPYPSLRHIKTEARTEGHWLNSQKVKIPPGLRPSDFDWAHSCPTTPWLTTFSSSFAEVSRIGEEPEQRKIELIQLRTSDVNNILIQCHLVANAGRQPPASEQALKGAMQQYIQTEKEKDRNPTQSGAEKAMPRLGICATRDRIHKMFRECCPNRPGPGRPKNRE